MKTGSYYTLLLYNGGRFFISTRKVSRIIKSLLESGKIIRIGSERKGYWKVNKSSGY